MAADPPRFGAHDGGALLPSELLELAQSRVELLARHMVGVAAELGALPATVRRIGGRLAPTAQGLAQPAVADPRLQQHRGQSGALEVGLAPGTRIATDVGDQLDAGAPQELDECPLLVIGVADREDLIA